MGAPKVTLCYAGLARFEGRHLMRVYAQKCDSCGVVVCYTSNQYVDEDYVACPACLVIETQ